MAKQEVGRELKASELKPDVVMVVQPPNKNIMITMWVRSVSPRVDGFGVVEFYAGEFHWAVINFIQPDGSIHDDQGRVVRVYEYLGEI